MILPNASNGQTFVDPNVYNPNFQRSNTEHVKKLGLKNTNQVNCNVSQRSQMSWDDQRQMADFRRFGSDVKTISNNSFVGNANGLTNNDPFVNNKTGIGCMQ